MAAEHHHNGFDQDQFERYDTFDAPVSDQVDPGRDGLVGDIGRLIDQVRISNAADKLDQNVSLGEDRALTDSGNWAAVPHRELYESVHANNDPAAAYALGREWTDLGNVMADNSRAMDEAIRGTESGWQGTSAQAARESTLKLATWGGDAAQTSQYMGTRIAEQGLAAERAKAAMPEPVEFDWQQMLRQGFATGGLVGFVKAVQDVQVVSEQARSAHEQAVRVMTEMETQSKSVDETTPRFIRPPDATSTEAGAANGLMMRSMDEMVPATQGTAATPMSPLSSASGGGVPLGQGQFAAAHGGAPGVPGDAGHPDAGHPDAGHPDAGHPDAGHPGGGSPGGGYGGGAGYQPAAASAGPSTFGSSQYVPPNIQVPDIPTGGGSYTGTSTSGFAPPPVPSGGSYPGGTPYPGTNYPTGNPPNINYPGGGPYLPGGGYNPGGTDKPGGVYNPGSGPYNPGGAKPPNSPNGYVPPKMPLVPGGFNPVTGEPYAPGAGPRPDVRPYTGGAGGPGGASGTGGAGGGGGGFGPRGAGGMAAGFGEQNAMRQPGPAAGAGALAAEEAAMRGNANPAGAARPGAAGAPGMGGGMGAGAGKRGEGDMEHRTKYATGEKIVEEPGRMVPLVIGEKPARQRKEE